MEFIIGVIAVLVTVDIFYLVWLNWKSNSDYFDIDIIYDGFGSSTSIVCPNCSGRTMQVVRPGDFQCSECS